MLNKRTIFLILFGLCIINMGVNNGILFPEIMEARNLVTAREIAQDGNWLSPTMNGYPRLAKPPFPTWLNAALALVVPVSNLAAHRLVSALAGILMVFFIYGIVNTIYRNKQLAFITGAVASTTYLIVFMSRQATWDIYTQSMMTGAIMFLIKAWKDDRATLRNYVLAGLFLGLSFFSKGPVSFYTMLLPFIASWLLMMRSGSGKKQQYGGLVITFVIFVVVSFWWPLYIYLINPDGLLGMVSRETQAWQNRHLRPFYFYAGFMIQMGVWVLPVTLSLAYPYMVKRVARKEYLFFFWWAIIALVLLSIPGEKKERYLLPLMVPLTITTGIFIHMLYERFRLNIQDSTDRKITRVVGFVYSIAGIGVGMVLNLLVPVSLTSLIALLVFVGIGIAAAWTTFKFNLKVLFIAPLALMSAVSLFIIPQADELRYTNDRYRDLTFLKEKEYFDLKWYGPNVDPRQIWDFEHKVDTLKLNDELILSPRENVYTVIIDNKIDKTSFEVAPTSVEFMDSIYYDPRIESRKFYIYRVEQ